MMLQKYPFAMLPSWRLSEDLRKMQLWGATPGLSSSGPVWTGSDLLASLSQIGVLAYIHSVRALYFGGLLFRCSVAFSAKSGLKSSIDSQASLR